MTQVAAPTSDTPAKNYERHSERYSRMSNDELALLSEDFNQLNEIAQSALIREIANRNLKENRAPNEKPELSTLNEASHESGLLWDYKRMSDEELHQLKAAYEKLHQPVPETLRVELNLRTSRRAQADREPTTPLTQVSSQHSVLAAPASSSALSQRQTVPAPYARLVVLFLLACLFASIGVFAFFDSLARNTTAVTTEMLAVLLTLGLGLGGLATWRRIRVIEGSGELKFRHRSRNAAITCIIFAVLYLGLAALLGTVIGQNRAEAIQFTFDWDHEKQLADKITKARTSVASTIPAYIAMYSAIEPDVREYSFTLFRLRTDLTKYDGKFPSEHKSTSRYTSSVEKEIQRSALLTKQIATAKQIGMLDENSQQAAWQNDMVPLLKQEDALDQSK